MTTTVTEAIRGAFIDLWANVVGIVPELVAALVVFIVGLIVAAIVGRLARKVVQVLKIDALADKMNVHDTLRSVGFHFSFSFVIGVIVKWFFIIVFLNAAVEILGWTQITMFLNDVLRYIPNVIVAVVIVAIGLIVAHVVERAVAHGLKSAKTPMRSPETLGMMSKWAVVAFAVMAALTQLSIAPSLIELLFGAILLTFVISFGLAGKEKATRFLDDLMR